MPNSKKKTPAGKCTAQYARTIKKTGKWRGQEPDLTRKSEDQVKSYRHIKRPKPCIHHYDQFDHCIHCGLRRPPLKLKKKRVRIKKK